MRQLPCWAGSRRAVTTLLELLDTGDHASRQSVINALGDAGGERAVTRLIDLANDPTERKRTDAIEALGATASADALPTLTGLLADDITEVREAAVDALGDLGTSGARKKLLELTASRDHSLRTEAIEALASYEDDEVQLRLAALAREPNPAVAKDLVILSALQNIRFELNEKGARLRSESHMAIGCAASPEPEAPRMMIFDKPFLVMLARQDAQVPYFALWVENAELMVQGR